MPSQGCYHLPSFKQSCSYQSRTHEHASTHLHASSTHQKADALLARALPCRFGYQPEARPHYLPPLSRFCYRGSQRYAAQSPQHPTISAPRQHRTALCKPPPHATHPNPKTPQTSKAKGDAQMKENSISVVRSQPTGSKTDSTQRSSRTRTRAQLNHYSNSSIAPIHCTPQHTQSQTINPRTRHSLYFIRHSQIKFEELQILRRTRKADTLLKHARQDRQPVALSTCSCRRYRWRS